MAFVLSNLGTDVTNTGAGDIELFLKQYAGEVLLAYDEMIKIAPLVNRRRIVNQKSAVFPVIGKANGIYHTLGEDILTDAGLDPDATTGAQNYLNAFKHSEKEVFCDDAFIAPVFIAELDELRNYYDVRMPYARKQAAELARNTDANLLRTILIGAADTDGHGTEFGDEHPLGQVVTNASAGTDGGELLKAIKEIAQAFDDDDVPEEGRFVAVKPQQYYNLVENQDLLNRDFGGQNGIFSDGTVFKAWGMSLVKTNLLPTANETGFQTTGQRGLTYDANFANTVAACWQREAVGSVSLMDVTTEMEYIIERQGHLMLAKVAEGHDWLRPAGLGQIKTA